MSYLIAILLVAQKKKYNISLRLYVCQSTKYFREREKENDLSLFLISKPPWYHSKKKKKLEVRVWNEMWCQLEKCKQVEEYLKAVIIWKRETQN